MGPTFEVGLVKRGEVPLTDQTWDILAYYIAQAALKRPSLRPNNCLWGRRYQSGVVRKSTDRIR